MNFSTVRRINDKISEWDVFGEFQVFIDTFHHPYLKVCQSFQMPSITLSGILDNKAEALTEVLLKYFPQLITGQQILPEPRPGKDSHQLQFIKEVTFENEKYVSLIKVNASYMGGARNEEVLIAGKQGVTPSILTDRVYFNSRLIPVSAIQMNDGFITNFIAKQVKDAIFYVSSRDTMRDVWSTVLFDEVDFTQVNKMFTSFLAFVNPWPTAHFLPLIVDYLTICFVGITGDSKETLSILPYFHGAFHMILEKGDCSAISDPDKNFWIQYFHSFQFERVASKSGNPHWQLKYEKLI